MVALLISVGTAGVLASLFALGFGFANNGFDLGNTLIIAGSSGLGSSLVLIALAAVVRELRRLGDAQRLAGRGPHVSEPGEAPAAHGGRPSGQRIPYPPRPVPEPPAREPRGGDPRGMAEPLDHPEAERPRPNIFAATRGGEPPPIAEPALPPLSPARPPVAPAPMASPPMMPPPMAPAPTDEAPYEPKFGPADILARLGGSRGKPEPIRDVPPVPMNEEFAAEPAPDDPVPPLRPESPRSDPSRPDPSRAGRGGMFESVWPADKPARPADADAIARAPKPEPRPESKYEPKRPRAEPPPLQSAVVGPPAPAAADPARPPEARTASILKSGVIDGMAYTLYTDGSIEAQLPQGTVHFASIEELRLHLERNG